MNSYENQEPDIELESQVSEDAFLNPVLQKYQTQEMQGIWQDELVASRKEREKFHKRGVETIKRYADEREGMDKLSNFNVFFANTEIKAASLYARTPQPDIKRRFNDATDQVARVASNILQRNITFELETSDFDAKLKQMLFDRLVPGMGVGWARLDQDEGEEELDPTTGQPGINSHIKDQSAEIDYVAWDDFHWAPCRVWTDCRWVARRVPMSKEAIADRFNGTADERTLANLSFQLPSITTPSATQSQGPKNAIQPTVDIFEIWDKERGLVFWIAESADIPLDVQEDANDFPDFFPTPLPPMCRTTTSSTTPISDFSLVQDLYNELDALNNRCSKLVRALQLKYVYDSSNDALKNLYTTTAEFEGIGVKDWAAMMGEKGGLRGAIEFAPLDEIASTYQKLVQARDMVKQQIYEIEGISDFLRGVQQPYITAAAATATSAASSTRLSVMQMEVANYIQRLLRLKAHLICKFYKPEIILARIGQMPQSDQQFMQQALELIGNEQMMHFRLEVSVDSIQQMNWNQDKADKNELVHAITALLGQIIPASQQNPAILPMGIELMKFMVSGYKGAKEFEGVLDTQMQQIQASIANKSQEPPKPTPEELKAQAKQADLQARVQIAQSSDQKDLQIAQMQGSIKQMDLQIKALLAQTKAKEVDANIVRDQAHTHIDVVSNAHANALDLIGGQ